MKNEYIYAIIVISVIIGIAIVVHKRNKRSKRNVNEVFFQNMKSLAAVRSSENMEYELSHDFDGKNSLFVPKGYTVSFGTVDKKDAEYSAGNYDDVIIDKVTTIFVKKIV